MLLLAKIKYKTPYDLEEGDGWKKHSTYRIVDANNERAAEIKAWRYVERFYPRAIEINVEVFGVIE